MRIVTIIPKVSKKYYLTVDVRYNIRIPTDILLRKISHSAEYMHLNEHSFI